MFAGLTLALLTSLFIFQTAKTQNILFHLLGNSTPTVYFALPTQNFSEMNGAWIDWPAGLLSWSKRRAISLTGPATTLSNFPVLVALDSTRIDYATTAAGGTDLRFTLDDGTALPYEIENWDSAGTSHVWVTLPTYTAYPAQTRIWMYHGNPAAANAQNASATWGTSHIGVWHLDGDAVDSSGGARNGTNTGATGATGLSGRAMAFTGTSTYIRLPDTMISDKTTATFEAWVKTSSSDAGVIGWGNSAYPAAPASYVPTFYFGNDGLLRAEQWHGASTPITTPSAQNNDEWKHLVLVVEPNSQSLYVNGTLIQTSAVTASTTSNTANYIGLAFTSSWPATAGSWRGLTGLVDEVRFSNVARSSAWVQQTYQSMRDLVAFYGPEENQNSGKAMISVVLSSISENTITVPYTVTGTSSQGADHNRAAGSITLAPGTVTSNLNTRIFRDNLVEGNETLILTLQTGTGYDVGGGGTHTVTIVDEPLVPPNAVDDTFNLTTLSPTNLNVLTNDTDDNSDPLMITSFTNPAHGTLVRVGQLLLYTPDGDFPATDTFTYTISDGRGGSDTATVTLNYQIPFTWTGLGGDANWSTPANWLGGAVPNPTDSAYFNNQCSTNCNPIIDSAAEILGLQMNSSFPGTLTQAATLIVRDRGWLQRAGAFVGATQNITITHPIRVLGGTFQSTAGELRLGSALTSRTLMEFAPGASFAHNNGVVYFNGRQPGCVPNQTLTLDLSPSITLYNATFYGDNNSSCGYSGYAVAAGDTLVVQNELRLNGGRLDGNYELKGDLIIAGGFGGNGTITVNGSGDQTYRWSANPVMSRAPNITIDKSSGSFRPFLGNNTLHTGRFLLLNGVFESPSATFDVLYRAPSDTIFQISSGATYEDGNGAISIYGAQPGCVSDQTFTIDVPNNHNFQSLTLTGNNDSSCGRSQLTLVPGRKVVVTGSFVHSGAGGIHGTFDILGNLSTSANGGSASFNFLGTAAQQISAAANSLPTGTMTINKASGTVTQITNASWSGAAQAVNVTSGILNLAGFNLIVGGTLTVGAAGKIFCNGGTVTATSSVINGEVSCGTSIGITWIGLAGDGLWSTAANWTNNSVPNLNDVARFNSICGASCNATINQNLTLRGIALQNTYAGTISQDPGRSITVGAAGWLQDAGTFLGSDASITVSGNLTLNGASAFQSTSNSLTLGASATFPPGTFTHNGGTVLSTTAGTLNFDQSTLNHLHLGGNSAALHTFVGEINVLGDITINSTGATPTMNGGTLNLNGNLNLSNVGKAGTTLIRLVSNSDQTIAASGQTLPAIELASTGGTVRMTGAVNITNDFTYTSGAFDQQGHEILFNRDQTITPGTITYGPMRFQGGGDQTIVGTLTIGGTLFLDDTSIASPYLNGGIIEAKGDVTVSSNGKQGTTLLRISGNTNQSISSATNGRILPLVIASTGGTVTISGSIQPSGDFTYSSGVVDASTSTLGFFYTQTISPGTIAFNNINFGGGSDTQTIVGTMTVTGTLGLQDSGNTTPFLNGGTIESYGDIVLTNNGKRGTTSIRAIGNGNRTISAMGSFIPTIEIDTGTGTTTLSGTIHPSADFIVTSGNIDAGTSTLNWVYSGNFKPSAANYNNVTFAGSNQTVDLGAETLNTLGNLSFADTSVTTGFINNGTILASGNVSFTDQGKRGNAVLRYQGATLTQLAALGVNLLQTSHEVNKMAGSQVRLQTNITYPVAGTTFTVNTGILNLNGFDLVVPSTFTVASGATLRCSGGDFTAGSTSLLGTIECPGYSTHPFNWTGNALDGNFMTAGNWQGGVAPTSADVVVFNDAYCGANCNANIVSPVNIRGIHMESGYTGTITQSDGQAITIGSRSWIQQSGTFLGSNAGITINRNLSVTGGSFLATSATLYIQNSAVATASFLHNGGTVSLGANGTGNVGLSFGANPLNNLSINVSYSPTTITGTLNVLGNFTLGGISSSISGGPINISGNFTNSQGSASGNSWIRMVGTANQNLEGIGPSPNIPNLEIASSGGTVSIVGNFGVRNSLLYTSGTVSAGTSQFIIGLNGGGSASVNAGPILFNDFRIQTSLSNTTITGSIRILGNLVTTGSSTSIQGGTVEIGGNYTSGVTTTSAITFNGVGTTQIFSGTTPTGLITINKPSGTLLLSSNTSFGGPGQDLNIVSGTLNMAGFNLNVGRNISNSGVLRRGTSPSCGSVTQGGSYTGNPPVCPPP